MQQRTFKYNKFKGSKTPMNTRYHMQRNFKNNKNLKNSLYPIENKMSCGFSSLFSKKS